MPAVSVGPGRNRYLCNGALARIVVVSLQSTISAAKPLSLRIPPTIVFQAAVRKRSRAADDLAAAHDDYARAVARCQPSGDNISAGPPSDVVLSGDKVVEASDAFAEAHGLAEEALSKLLEERGRCLRDAMSSVR